MVPSVPTLALTCLLLLAAGWIVLLVLWQIPRLNSTIRETCPILVAETLIVGLYAGAFWVGGLLLDAALLALVFRCVWEAAHIARMRYPVARLSSLQIAAGVTGLAFIASYLPMGGLVVTLIALGLLTVILRKNSVLNAGGTLALLLELSVFPIFPLILFAAAGLQGGFSPWLLVAFILVETFDSYALAGGKLFGRTKAFPLLSPRKTVEGLVSGAVMLMLTAALAGAAFGVPVLASSLIALVAGILAVIGDLVASALKRRSKVKDFPPVLAHQGGLLDIADAWIVAGAGLVALVALSGLG